MISAVVLTKNEEKNIEDCLKTLSWCDEIVVIDDNSTDRTTELAGQPGVKVYSHPLNNDFSGQRNFGLSHCANDWVLFVDADERVSPELAKEITEKVKKGNVDAYMIKRIDNLFGIWLKHGETGNINLLRLAKKNSGRWVRNVHETWTVETQSIVSLQFPLLHYPHQSLTEFLHDINYYSTLNAQQFIQEGKKVTVLEILTYPAGKFIRNYLLKRGFLDGTPGFIMAMMMSFHSFLTRAKMWQLQGAER